MGLIYREAGESCARQYAPAPARGFLGYGETKKEIIRRMDQYFGVARLEYERLLKPTSELDDVLAEGAKHARAEARKTLDACRQAVGLA